MFPYERKISIAAAALAAGVLPSLLSLAPALAQKSPAKKSAQPAGGGTAAAAPKPKTSPKPAEQQQQPPPPMDETQQRRQMATKTLALLQKSMATFTKLSGPTCGSCHHQMLPVMTLAVAREHGVKPDEAKARAQREILAKTIAWAHPMVTRALTNPGTDKEMDSGDAVIVFGYLMAGFAAEKKAPDAFTDDVARYLLRKQRPDGRYAAFGSRAPMEGNEFTSTALAVRTLATYTPKDDAATAAGVIARAREWLATTRTKTNEDRVFRLLGLYWGGADPEAIRKATDDLLAEQNDDGGWSQLPYQLLSSDAYATGQALFALRVAGGLSADEAAYQRALRFLMSSQRPDGTWYVKKRCHPVVPYFDADFPGGKDQYISFVASCWATMALSLSLPEALQAATPTVAQAIPAPTAAASGTR